MEIILWVVALGVIYGAVYWVFYKADLRAEDDIDDDEEPFDFPAWSLNRHKAGFHENMNVWSCPLCAQERDDDE